MQAAAASIPVMASKIFVDEETLIGDAFRLGVNIFNDGFRPTFLVGLWRGGSSIGIYVQECLQYLGVDANHIAVRTSYTGQPDYQDMVENPESRIRVHGTQYLLDDVCSTGLTLQAVVARLQLRLKRNMPGKVKIATVWNKPGHNRSGIIPDYFLHETEDWLVLPYELKGLTMDEVREHKPLVAALIEGTVQ